MNPSFDCAVIGAGISGLTVANELAKQGQRVVILEKSRGLGGRFATRRWGDATSPIVADTGAQYLPLPAHDRAVAISGNSEVILMDSDTPGESARIVHPGGMSRLARALLETGPSDPRIELGTRALRLEPPHQSTGDWCIHAATHTEETKLFHAREVVLALPIPQSIELLDSTLPIGAESPAPWDELRSVQYSRCLTVIATLREDVLLSGRTIAKEHELAGIFIQRAKGLLTSRPTVVVQTSPSRSLELWESEPETAAKIIWDTARSYLSTSTNRKCEAETLALHRWRYARPETLLPESCALYPFGVGRIGICGDAFASGGIDGAFASAQALTQKMGRR